MMRTSGDHRFLMIVSAWIVAAVLTPRWSDAEHRGPQTRPPSPCAVDTPELATSVNDFAHVIDAASAKQLDALIDAHHRATGDSIVIATIATMSPCPDIVSYSMRMFENHGRGIGERVKNNGLLVLVAVNDRQVRITTGVGLEHLVTNDDATSIVKAMVPVLAQGRYGPALILATQTLSRQMRARQQ